MKTENYDLVGSYNNQRVSSIDAERSVNLFEYIDPLGKKPRTLINTSGLINPAINFPGAAGGFREQFVFQDNEYSVIGSGVFKRTPVNVVSFLGSITTTIGHIGIDANTFQILFVDGAKGYIWDTIANSFTQITDVSFPAKPLDCCYLDGFFVLANGDTNNFQLSMFNQGLIWGPSVDVFTADSTVGNNWLILANTANYQTGIEITLSTTGSLPNPLVTSTDYWVIQVDNTHIRLATSYANAIAHIPITLTTNGTPTNTITNNGQLQQGSITSHPGTIVGCRTLHRRLFLFSQFFTEVWENAGIGTNLPFRRNNSLLMEYGTPAVSSISVGFDIMMFLSQSRDGLGSVMLVSGTSSMPVSNRALDFQLAQYATNQQVSDCVGFLIKENGLIFYRMNFTAANHTFVYNVTLSDPSREEGRLWHEEEVLNGDRHPAQTHSYLNGVNYVGNYDLPILYQLDSQTYTNDGEPIRRMRIGKAIVPPGYQRLRIDRFQIDLLQGNIAGIPENLPDLDLLTEMGDIILTESGLDILLETGNSGTGGNQAIPYAFLSISKDGGQSYGYVIKAPMGLVGQRTFRTLWRKLGTIPRGQAFVPKLEFFNTLPIVILGAAWAYEVMPE